LDDIQSLSHTVWDCKYHIVWIPKRRRKVLYGGIRKDLVDVFRELARRKESEILEGSLRPDHVHVYLSIPPKYAVCNVVRFIKGKSAIHIARTYGGRARNFTGENFWARGYSASTVGRDERVIREYIRKQEAEDERLEQLNLLK
jgi:putative transposase